MPQLYAGVPRGGAGWGVFQDKWTLLFTLTTRLFGLFYRSRLEINGAGQGEAAVFFGAGLRKVQFIKAFKNFTELLKQPSKVTFV